MLVYITGLFQLIGKIVGELPKRGFGCILLFTEKHAFELRRFSDLHDLPFLGLAEAQGVISYYQVQGVFSFILYLLDYDLYQAIAFMVGYKLAYIVERKRIGIFVNVQLRAYSPPR
jgi:hypothetical protein